MAKLEGVKTLDMENGEITKVEYNGEVYERVGKKGGKEGDIGLRIRRNAYYVNIGEYYPITINRGNLAFKDDIGQNPYIHEELENFAYFRKPSEPSLKVGDKVRLISKRPIHGFGGARVGDVGEIRSIIGEDIAINFPNHSHWNGVISEIEPVESPKVKVGDTIRMVENCPAGGYSTGDTFAVISVDDDGATFVDNDGDHRSVGFKYDTRYEVVTDLEPEEEARPKRTIAISGDVVEMITDDDYGDYKNGSRFTVKEDSEVREYSIDNNGDKRYINEFDHLEYRIVEFAEEIDHETPELFAKVNRPNNVPITGDYVEFRDDIAEDCSAFLTVGKKYEVERVDAFGGADITDDNGYFESAEPDETKAIYVKYTQEQAEKKAGVGDKILVVDAKLTGGRYTNGDVLTVIEDSPSGVFSLNESGNSVRLWYEEFIVLNPEQVGEPKAEEKDVEEPEVEESKAEGVPFEVGQFVVAEDNDSYTYTIPEAGALEVVEVGEFILGGDIRVKFHREFKGKYGAVVSKGVTFPVNSDYFRLATDEEIAESLGLNEIKKGDKVEVLAENHPILSKGATFTVTDVDKNGVRLGSTYVAFVSHGKPRLKLVEEGPQVIESGDLVQVIDSPSALLNGSYFVVKGVSDDGSTLRGVRPNSVFDTEYVYAAKHVRLIAKAGEGEGDRFYG